MPRCKVEIHAGCLCEGLCPNFSHPHAASHPGGYQSQVYMGGPCPGPAGVPAGFSVAVVLGTMGPAPTATLSCSLDNLGCRRCQQIGNQAHSERKSPARTQRPPRVLQSRAKDRATNRSQHGRACRLRQGRAPHPPPPAAHQWGDSACLLRTGFWMQGHVSSTVK